mmetsp:Transcript_6156/g.11177  ORF Transcript_6156/g.11177 Transcript_6156/m.11177 type:complete len:252 (-) Transcript_6156:1729-2484(-)
MDSLWISIYTTKYALLPIHLSTKNTERRKSRSAWRQSGPAESLQKQLPPSHLRPLTLISPNDCKPKLSPIQSPERSQKVFYRTIVLGICSITQTFRLTKKMKTSSCEILVAWPRQLQRENETKIWIVTMTGTTVLSAKIIVAKVSKQKQSDFVVSKTTTTTTMMMTTMITTVIVKTKMVFEEEKLEVKRIKKSKNWAIERRNQRRKEKSRRNPKIQLCMKLMIWETQVVRRCMLAWEETARRIRSKKRYAE